MLRMLILRIFGFFDFLFFWADKGVFDELVGNCYGPGLLRLICVRGCWDFASGSDVVIEMFGSRCFLACMFVDSSGL